MLTSKGCNLEQYTRKGFITVNLVYLVQCIYLQYEKMDINVQCGVILNTCAGEMEYFTSKQLKQ